MEDLKISPLSRAGRIGDWIVNCCILVALASAWSVEKWPAFTYYAVAAVALASIVSLIVLGTITYRDQLSAFMTRPIHRRNLPWASSRRMVSREQYASHRDAAALNDRYTVLVKSLISRDAQLSERYFGLLQSLHSVPTSAVAAALARELSTRAVVAEGHHFRIDPPSTRYTVTIGVVQIEVDGDETKVKVKESKKVAIETPVRSQISESTKVGAAEESLGSKLIN